MANPVGVARKLQVVDDYVASKIKEWQDENHPASWWQFWKKDASSYKATKFLISTVDDLVNLVQQHIPAGADKKATVLAALGAIYDFVVTTSLPIWAKPFSKQVRILLIDVLLSELIDFLVGKYKDGTWADFPAPTAQPTTEQAPPAQPQ